MPVLSAWMAGGLITLVIFFVRIVRFRRKVAQAQAAPRWLSEELSRFASRLSVKPPAVLVVEQLGSPLIWCWPRAKLLWPAALCGQIETERVRGVIVHELAHLRRRDHWVAWLELVAAGLWWWNPLFWYVRRRLRESAELACDAWVLWALPDDRRLYAESLIEVSQLISQGPAAAPAVGVVGNPRRNFERRLTMILQDSVPRRIPKAAIVFIGLLALAVLPGWLPGQVDTE